MCRWKKIFLAMALIFLAYPIAAVLANPDWSAVARGAFVPSLRADPDYLFLFVGLLGATMTPYVQLFQQRSVVEKGVLRRQYGPERADAYFGAVFANIIAAFIVIATGATLHVAGVTNIQTASDAAQSLQPLVGDAAQALFAFGLLGASLLAAGVLPLATAYSVAEAFGFRKGVDLDFRRAPVFVGIFSALIALGGLVALIPGLPLIQLLVGIQVLNGMLLPVILIFLLLLVNDRRLVGSLANGLIYSLLSLGHGGAGDHRGHRPTGHAAALGHQSCSSGRRLISAWSHADGAVHKVMAAAEVGVVTWIGKGEREGLVLVEQSRIERTTRRIGSAVGDAVDDGVVVGPGDRRANRHLKRRGLESELEDVRGGGRILGMGYRYPEE